MRKIGLQTQDKCFTKSTLQALAFSQYSWSSRTGQVTKVGNLEEEYLSFRHNSTTGTFLFGTHFLYPFSHWVLLSAVWNGF